MPRERGPPQNEAGKPCVLTPSSTLALTEGLNFSSERDRELVCIDEALEAMAQMDPRKARVVELRFFAGLSVEETAEVLKISPQSVMRDWKLAKAWLTRELKSGRS